MDDLQKGTPLQSHPSSVLSFFSILLGFLNSFLRRVRPLCHCSCPPFSAGDATFLFVCLPGLSLVVSALVLCFYSFVSQVRHCWCRLWWCPPFSVGHVAFLFICLPGLSLLVSALFVGHAAFLFISLPGLSLLVFFQVCHCWCPPFSAGHVAFLFICLPWAHVISFFLSFRFGACTAVFCPVRWNRFACERFLLLCKGCVTVSGIAFLPHCVTLSALLSFSGNRWMNDRISAAWQRSLCSIGTEGIRQAPKINFISHPSLLMLLFLVLTWSAPR